MAALSLCVSARHWTQDSQHQTGGSTARGSSQSGDRCSESSRRISGADGEPVHGEEEACKQSCLSSVGSADDATGDTSGHGGNNQLARPLSGRCPGPSIVSSLANLSDLRWSGNPRYWLQPIRNQRVWVCACIHVRIYASMGGCVRGPRLVCLFVCLFVS